MNSLTRIIVICLAIIAINTGYCVAGEDAFGFEANSRGDIVVFADHYISDHLMLHPWIVPSNQGNFILRVALNPPVLSKFEFGAGPKYAAVDGVEKIRAISSELTFNLPLGKHLTWKSYNLFQQAIDDVSPNSGLLRQQLHIENTKYGIFNDNQLRQYEKPKIFLGGYYDLAPIRFTSTFKVIFNTNIKDLDENRMLLIIEF